MSKYKWGTYEQKKPGPLDLTGVPGDGSKERIASILFNPRAMFENWQRYLRHRWDWVEPAEASYDSPSSPIYNKMEKAAILARDDWKRKLNQQAEDRKDLALSKIRLRDEMLSKEQIKKRLALITGIQPKKIDPIIRTPAMLKALSMLKINVNEPTGEYEKGARGWYEKGKQEVANPHLKSKSGAIKLINGIRRVANGHKRPDFGRSLEDKEKFEIERARQIAQAEKDKLATIDKKTGKAVMPKNIPEGIDKTKEGILANIRRRYEVQRALEEEKRKQKESTLKQGEGIFPSNVKY
jgi:hypothetical protein